MKNVLRVLLLVIFVFFNANAVASPNSLTYQGRIIKSDGTALEYSNVSFLFEVTSEDGSCVIYREQRDGVNMVNSKGLFDVAIGSGTRLFPDTGSNPTYTLSQAFGNGVSHSCFGSGSWTASVDSYRKLKVQFHDGNGWQVITPDSIIRSVPFALTAKSATQLGDKTINDFVLKSNAPGSACTAGQVVSWDGTNFSCVTDAGGSGVISDVLAGTGIAVSGTTSKTIAVTFGTTAGTVAQGNDSRIANALQSSTVFAGDVSGTATSMSVDKIKGVTVDSTAPTSGQVLRYDGAKWAAATPNAGTVTSVGVSVPSFLSASGGPITSSGTIVISLASQTGNTVFAAPNGSSGAPTFRTLGITDIFSSIGGLSFLNTSPSCTAGSALTYVSATDRIECASIAVDTANVADSAITTAKIADGAVTASKLGSDVGAWSTSSGNVYRTTGKVGIGTSTPGEALEVSSESNWATVASVTYNTTMSPAMVGYRYRGTKASPTIVANGDYVYSNQGWAYDGANLRKVAAVGFVVDGTPGAGDMPGAILFQTTNDGTASATEKMRLTNQGRLGIGTASPVTSLDLSSKTDAIYFPKGTTAQQPSSPAAGMIRYNTDNNAAEFYNGSSWVNLAAITSGGTMTNVSTITGGASGVNITAGGTNQNVTLTASGTGTVTTGSVMTITNSTASTAYNNGALVVSGGVGVSGNINSNGNMYAAGSIAAGTSLYSPLIYGSTAASGTLTLDSTSDATKGNILLAPGGGNVGIGTNSPAAKLDSAGEVFIRSATGGALAASAGKGLKLEYSSGYDTGIVQGYDYSSSTAKSLSLQPSGGNVGIGTTSPASIFTIDTAGTGYQKHYITNRSSSTGNTWNDIPGVVLIKNHSNDSSVKSPTVASESIGEYVFGAVNADLSELNVAGISAVQVGSAASGAPNGANLHFKTADGLGGGLGTKMILTNSGNVGIGTASPAAKLEVNGSIKQGKYIQNFYHFFAGSAWQSGSDRRYLRIDTNIPWGDGPYINLFIRGMHYDAMKSIDLQISWYMYGSGFHGPHVTSNGTSTPAVSLANESGKVSILLDAGSAGRWYWSSFKFDAQYENVSDPTIFDGWTAAEAPFTGAATGIVGPLTPNNGPVTFGNKVGIGTTTPTHALEINNGTDGMAAIKISNANASSASYLSLVNNASQEGHFGLGASGHSDVAVKNRLYMYAGSADAISLYGSGKPIEFYTYSSANTSMYIGTSGNVGIGSSNPGTQLEVVDFTGGSSRGIRSTTFSSSNPGGVVSVRGARGTPASPLAIQSGDNLGWFVADGYNGADFSNHNTPSGMSIYATENWTSSANGTALRFLTVPNGGTNGIVRMHVGQDGNVGIGTTSPSFKLDVQGGDINASGSVRAAGVALSSDARFKRNIASITNPLGKVLALRGVEYDWKTDQYPERKFNDRHQIGVIAQEVEKVFPEVVDTDKQGYKSVNYPALVAPLIGAIKELYAKLVGVDARVAELERENALLKAQNQELKKDVDQIKKSLGIK